MPERRRGHDQGSIRQRTDGSWEVRFVIGKTASGAPHRKSWYFPDRAKARAFAKSYAAQLAQGEVHTPSQAILRDWVRQCIDVYGKQQQDNTIIGYESYFKKHIKDSELGSMPICNIKSLHVQGFVNALSEKPNGRGGTLSAKTVNNVVQFMSWFFNQAIRNRLILSNPIEGVQKPTVLKPQITIIDPDLLPSFWVAMSTDRDFCAYVLDSCTGLRRSELLALKWDCVDLPGRRITVMRKLTRDRDNGGFKLVDTHLKSDSALRWVNIPDEAVSLLKAHKARQNEQRLVIGEYWDDNNLVFCNEVGRWYEPGAWVRRFQQNLVDAGLPPAGLHAMRHLVATSLIRASIDDPTIAAILGHSNANFTRKQYADVYDMSKMTAADIAGRAAKLPASTPD